MKSRWMVDRGFDRRWWLRASLAATLLAPALGTGRTWAQSGAVPGLPDASETPVLPSKEAAPPRPRLASRQPLGSGTEPLPPGLTNSNRDMRSLPSGNSPSLPPPGLTGLTGKEIVAKVLIDPPLKHHSEQAVRRFIKTIADRPFDVRTVDEDVRRLATSKLFLGNSVNAEYQRVGERGIVVIYHMIESPTIKYLRFFGQVKVKERHLKKQSGLKVGASLDPWTVRDGATKVEEYYHEKGFNKATVKVLEGTGKDDRGAVYLVNEGQKQKIAHVVFEGNTIATDGRLKTQIQSKPPLLWVFKGEVDREKIQEDVARLAEYYRNLGFISARVNRELVWNEDQNWLTVRFVIDEGPRYKMRSIGFVGQRLYTSEELSEKLKLRVGDYFDKGKLDKDKKFLEEKYGVKGYVFANIQQEARLNSNRDDLDQIDLLYQIDEGSPCYVSRVDVKIGGDNPHTRRNTVLNRVSLHPGDLLSTRELRDSETRLKRSALFKNTPDEGPRITFERPEPSQETGLAGRPVGPGGFRGQSPDAPRREAQ